MWGLKRKQRIACMDLCTRHMHDDACINTHTYVYLHMYWFSTKWCIALVRVGTSIATHGSRVLKVHGSKNGWCNFSGLGVVLPDPDLNGTTAGTTMIVWPWGPVFVAATFPLYTVDFVAMGPRKRRMSFTQSSKSPATPNEMRHLYLDMTWIYEGCSTAKTFFCDLCFHMFSCPRWLPVGRNAGTPFKVGWPSPTLELPSESSQCLDLLCLVRWAAWRMWRWAFPIGFTGVDAHE